MAIDIQASAVALKDVRENLDRLETSLQRLEEAIGPDLSSLLDVHGAFSQVIPVVEKMEALFGAAEVYEPPPRARRPSSRAPRVGVVRRPVEPRKSVSSPARRKSGPRPGPRVKMTEAKMRAALDATGGVKSRAAAKLGVSSVTFRKYELQFGMAEPQPKSEKPAKGASAPAPASDEAPPPKAKTYRLRKRSKADPEGGHETD